MKAWNRFWFTPGPASTLGTCRLLFFGALFAWQLPHDFAPWGNYSSVFWMPIWLFDTTGVPALSAQMLGWVQSVWKLSLLLSAIGLWTRPAMVVSAVAGAYLMGLPHNFGQTQHFDTLVVFACVALAMSSAGDAVSVDALLRTATREEFDAKPDGPEYTWPIRFVWVATALIFCAAGISKLRHSGPGWIFSDNLALLLLKQQYHLSDGEPWTAWGIVVAHHRGLAQALAASAVMIETLFPLALFSVRARWLLVPSGLAFLIGIRTLMGPTFEQFMMCYVFWIPWASVAAALRERFAIGVERLVVYDGGCGLCSGTIALLTRLDILGRLRYADLAADWATITAAYPMLDRQACVADMHVIVRRDTSSARAPEILTGFDAYRSMMWVIPLGWPLLPFLHLPSAALIGRRVYRVVALGRTTTSCLLPTAAPTARRIT